MYFLSNNPVVQIPKIGETCINVFPCFLVYHFFSFFSCARFCFSVFANPPHPPKNKWLARLIANMREKRDTIRNESWSWNVIFWTLSPTIGLSWLETWSESGSVLAHSLLVLVAFAAARAGVTQCSPPLIFSPVHIKNVELWTCCVKYFWSRLDRYIGKHIIYLVKNG